MDNQKKVVIIFHGNAGSASDRVSYEHFFNGFNIFINEYPGYGLNYHETIDMNKLDERAKEMLEYVLKHYSKKDVLIVGESLGTGLAAKMATQFSIPHLLLITPYTSLKEVAQDKFWYLPAQYLLRYNFDNVKTLHDYSGESLVIAAQNDNVIAEKFAKKLFNNIPSQKQYILVLGAGHNSWSHYLMPEQKKQINHFLDGI